MRSFVRALAVVGVVALAACGSGSGTDDDASSVSAGAIADVPAAAVRDQKETGNCWLFATTAWAESLERAATGSSEDLALSVTYLDYWDWFTTITTGAIDAKTASAVNDELDAGGSWGTAVELIARYGVARARDFGGDGAKKDADLVAAAGKAMARSLLHGALMSKAARRDPARVRRELDVAFGVSAALSRELGATFGEDGARGFDHGATPRPDGRVLDPRAIPALAPHPDGTREVVTLRDLIGERVAGDNPEHRKGPFAWSDVTYRRHSKAETRAFFRRIQTALHAGVPLPIGWFFADNIDPGNTGIVASVPAAPAGDKDSVDHETVIVDYEVEDVPGYGTLRAGVVASEEAKRAALADDARVTFLRLADSYGTHIVNGKLANVRDLYVDYLLGTVKVCKASATSPSQCHDVLPLEDVTFPPGF